MKNTLRDLDVGDRPGINSTLASQFATISDDPLGQKENRSSDMDLAHFTIPLRESLAVLGLVMIIRVKMVLLVPS